MNTSLRITREKYRNTLIAGFVLLLTMGWKDEEENTKEVDLHLLERSISETMSPALKLSIRTGAHHLIKRDK